MTLCVPPANALIPNATYVWTRNGLLLSETDFDLEVSEAGNYEVLVTLEDDDCSTIEGQAVIRYVTAPEVDDATLIQCEDEIVDGSTLFNLNEASQNIVGIRRNNLTISYHLTQADALSNLNPIF